MFPRWSRARLSAWLCCLLAAVFGFTLVPVAHETTTKLKVPIVLRDAMGPSGPYRIAFGCIPSTPASGQVVRCEVKVVPFAGSTARRPIAPVAPVAIEAVEGGQSLALVVEEENGAYTIEHAFERSGEQALLVRVGGDQSISFPVRVLAGVAERLQWWLAAIAVLIATAIGVPAVRRRRALGDPWTGLAAIYVVATAIAVAVVVSLVAPFVGRRASATHGDASVDWSAFEQAGGMSVPRDADLESPNREDRQDEQQAPGAPAAGGQTVELTGRVVARPGTVVDVLVPVTGRVVVDPAFVPVIGKRVAAGQTLVRLEHHYIMHDAVHLINERWPILSAMLTANRQAIDAEVALERLQYLYKNNGVALGQLQQAEATSTMLTREADRWRNQLAMHDAQITESDMTVRPLVTPIAGVVSAARFTQGQIANEGDKLFTIADLSRVWVEVDVPEAASARVREHAARVQLSTAGGRDGLAGRFVRTGQVVNADTRTIPFYFEVANPQDRLAVGMTVNARLDAPGGGRDANEPARAAQPRTIHAAATVQADPLREVQVVAPIWGRIEWGARALAVGDAVKKDEELLRLVLELPISERYLMNTRLLELHSALDVVKKRKEQADIDRRRAVALLRTNSGDPLLRNQVVWAEKVLRAAEEEEGLVARQSTAFDGVIKRRDPKITPVTAPIGGTVTDIAFRPGELDLTQEFRKLLTIADLSDVWLAADVFERDLDAIRRCRHTTFTTPGGVTRPLGLPIAISPFVDEKKRTVQVIFRVPNPKHDLPLGGAATLAFDVE